MKRAEWLVLQAEIEADLKDLAQLVREIEETARALPPEPSHRDKAALGAFVHSFYNGIENILKRLAQEIDHSIPVGEGWHRALLRRMATEVPGVRPAILQQETAEALEPYLGFRHFFRHAYTFHIEWEKLQPLIEKVGEVFERVRNDLERFFTAQA
jgi:hypothetical protein